MKKQSRSKKPNARRAPKAPAPPARGPTAAKRSNGSIAATSQARAANDIGPILSRVLFLPQSPRPAAKSRRAIAHATTARLTDDTSAFLLLSLPILAMIAGLGLMQSLKPIRRAELTALPAPTRASPNLASAPTITVARTPLASSPALMRPATSAAEIAAASTAPIPLTAPSQLTAAPARTAMLNEAPLPDTIASSITLPQPALPSRALPELAVRDALSDNGDPAVCPAPAAVLARARPPLPSDPAVASLTPTAFGQSLANAAQTQTKDFVIYNDKYRAISYPNGDVQPLYGVCTDVVIRAYRALGIDLQQLVHEARIGSGDVSIDHRRTEVLRRFFTRFGQQLPASTYAEDYLPGDIVTYNRPQNRHSRAHIAMVSNVVGVSGRYMIVHNRGWGPQLEDALFVDEITGHYRYRTAPTPPAPAIATARTAPAVATSMPQKRPPAMARVAAREARVEAARRRDGAAVPGLGR